MEPNPSFESDLSAEITGQVCHDFDAKLRFVACDDNEIHKCHLPHEAYCNVEKSLEDQYNNQAGDQNHGEGKENGDHEDDYDDDDDDFSFVLNGDDSLPITADEAFVNGQIRPIFPFFGRDLLISNENSEALEDRLPVKPPVKNVFIQEPGSYSENDDIEGIAAGPYREWSKKSIEGSREGCQKSNSTGFSKLWRFRDIRYRSNSDGRDAFVFLNNSNAAATSAKKEEREKAGEKKQESSEKKKTSGGEPKEKGPAAGGACRKVNKKKGNKAETSSLSAYMKDRAADEGRRRSYLPYRPELVGFFTTVSGGGLSRNVHPF